MLKNDEVANITVGELGVPTSIESVINPELLPVAFLDKSDEPLEKRFDRWINRRKIPSKRDGLKFLCNLWGQRWLISPYYASLSDQYWIKKDDKTWEDVNFFTRKYSLDVNHVVFSPWLMTSTKGFSLDSPDLTTNGMLKKTWIQKEDGTSMLVKCSSEAFRQEPMNEVLTYLLCVQLNIPCVKYDFHIEGVELSSICDNFINETTELVPSTDFYYFKTRDKSQESIYSHLLKMCELLDIPNAEMYVNQIICVDRLTGNVDRNLSNISFIRDSNTKKFIGPAPLYDNGGAYMKSENVNRVFNPNFVDVGENIFKKYFKGKNMPKDDLFEAEIVGILSNYPYLSKTKQTNLLEQIRKTNAFLQHPVFLNNLER